MLSEAHRSFLLDERGIRSETAEAFGLRTEGANLILPHRTGEKTRFFTGEQRFAFTKGQQPYLYGPPGGGRDCKVAFLVEGETDTLRLYQALEDADAEATVYGIPGIHTWKPYWAKELEYYDQIFVILDNDQDYMVRGQVDGLWEKLLVDVGAGKLTRVYLPEGVKDVCDFFRNFDLDFLREVVSDATQGKLHYKALDLTIAPPPFEWLIDGFICKGDTVLWMGPPGIGKSISALSLGVAVAAGKKEWLGMPLLREGKVMVIDRENPRDVVYNRLHGFGATPEVLENFRYILHQDVRLDDRARASKLMDEVRAFKPELIILDSLVRFHRMDENSATQMAQVFDEGIKPLAQETGATVIVIHHSVKSDTNNSLQKQRGSGEITAAPDTGVEVKQLDDNGGVCLKHYKGRRSRNNEVINFVIEEDDDGRMNVHRVAAHF